MDLNFCRKYSYTGHILNSLFASCASWLDFSSAPSSSLYSFSYCTHFTLISKNLGTRSWLLSWRSCGEVTVTVQHFSFTMIRHQDMYPHNSHKTLIFHNTPAQSHDVWSLMEEVTNKIVKASKSVVVSFNRMVLRVWSWEGSVYL
jgi:hypothetical protein